MNIPPFKYKYCLKFEYGPKALVIFKRDSGYYMCGLVKDTAPDLVTLGFMVNDLIRDYGRVTWHGPIEETSSTQRAAQKLLSKFNIRL